MNPKKRLPIWLKRRLPANTAYDHTDNVLNTLGLETICTNANCPNKGECWERGTATVLILGNICTRNCKFCSVGTGKPKAVDASEADRVADMADQMKIKYLVITSVDRDDLPDGGANHFRNVINCSRQRIPGIQFELLVPDFRDCQDEALEILSDALPFVFGHNIETVPNLYSKARPGGNYELSLDLLRKAKDKYNLTTKSSIMLGLGETEDQVIQTLRDIRETGCDRIAIGQYLRPGKDALEVEEFVEPEKFEWWKQKAKEIGFTWVMSSPFTRSSFHAEQIQTP
jgi:lipoic acid synthetase